MPALLTWDEEGSRLYQTGVDRPVIYLKDSLGAYPLGVPWNGLTAVNEKPGGADASDLYANNKKYLALMAPETFEGTIEAYTYPDDWALADGSVEIIPGFVADQQVRKEFGLTYRVLVGNDVEFEDHGYIIHVIYGAKAGPSEKSNSTINESPEAATLSWDFTTTPVDVPNFRPSAHLKFDSSKLTAVQLAALEVVLYGETGVPDVDARLPLPAELITIITDAV